jgi:electron transfer flavoprotein beta subunit
MAAQSVTVLGAMDIVVTVKQVPDPDIPPTHFRIDEATRKVVPPAGVAPVMNGYDAHALEAALRLREQLGGKITVVSLGPDSARDTLKRALAMGADAAVHVNDPGLIDADGPTTARALAAAIKKIGDFQLILSGRQASDTDGGQVHLGIAAQLGVPAVSPVQKIEEVTESSATVERIVSDGFQRVKVQLPALLGVSSELNEPRYPPLKGIMAAGRAQIPVWTAADLGLDGTAPRVQLRRLYIETREARVELIEADSPAEAGTRLADKLREARLV